MKSVDVRFLASAMFVSFMVSCASAPLNPPGKAGPSPSCSITVGVDTTVSGGSCSGSASPPPPIPSVSAPSDLRLTAFWQSWSDTALPLSSTPAGVTTVDVAFSTAIANGTLATVQNTNPITPGAAAIHARGGKVLISFGGATGAGAYANLNAGAFVGALGAFFAATPGVYDGVDFDDEQDPRNAQTLISVIEATRAAFPNIIITYDAFPSGADAGAGAQAGRSDRQGSDIPVAAAVAQAITWVNVMDYNFGGWTPSDDMNCTVGQTAANDCRRDVMEDFAKIYPKNKLVMGLEVPSDDNGIVKVSPTDAGAYASWVKANGYEGIMVWDLNRDTGLSAIDAIAAGLGR